MKILHTSDWHLGKKLVDKDRQEEQEKVMDEIIGIADSEGCDMVIVAGDLFDTYSPSSVAQRLFYSTIQRLTANGTRPVICIAGNHDSPERVESPEALADVSGIFLLGYPNSTPEVFQTHNGIEVTRADEGFMELLLPQLPYPIRIIFTPFANGERLKTFLGVDNADATLRETLEAKWQTLAEKYCNTDGVNLLTTHQFVTHGVDDTDSREPDDENIINVGGTSAIYLENIPKEVQYVALGHIHRCYRVGNHEVWYSGSPLEYSFAESEQEKYVLVSEIEPRGQAKTKKIPLRNGYKLVCKTFDTVDEACLWLKQNPDVWVDLTMNTETFMTVAETKAIYESHNKIVNLRPAVKSTGDNKSDTSNISELVKDKDALFAKFFELKTSQKPNDDIMNLFHEIMAK